MSVQTWATQWRELLTADRRLSVPDAFSGDRPMQLAEQFPSRAADPDHRIVFEHGVLALFDESRREVVLLAVPSWAGETWRASDTAEQEWITDAAETAAAENGVDITALRGPGGAQRTIYTRVVPLGDPWLLPTEPTFEFSVGTGGFSDSGMLRVQDFADAVGRAGAAFLAEVDYPLPAATAADAERARTEDPEPADPDEAPAIPLDPPVAPLPARIANAVPNGHAAAAATGTRRRTRIVTAAFALLFGALLAIGTARGYTVEVVDQPAKAATTHQEPTGRIDLAEDNSRWICGGGEDYRRCVTKLETTYKSSCTGVELTESAAALCADFNSSLDEAHREQAKCDESCLTVVGDNGTWGWPYLTSTPEMHAVSDGNGFAKRTHEERCMINLGPIQIGTCTR